MTITAENVSNCVDYEIPSFQDYLAATNQYGIAIFTLGAFLLLSTIFMFLDTLRHILQNTSANVKESSAFVMAVYPVTSLASFVAILVPRANLLSEAITQGAFMAGMYKLFCLFIAYCGGASEMVKKLERTKLNLKLGPCCCWPCCCFPTYVVTKKTVMVLRILVLQLPLVQCFIYLVYLIMWAERESLYQVNYMYLQPLLITSMLFGIWGILMTISVLKEALDEHFYLNRKFMILQLVLIFSKLQGLITRILIWTHALPCKGNITPQVYANLLLNSLMIIEMTMLCFLARNLYKKTLPKSKEDKTGVITDEGFQKNCDISRNDIKISFENEAFAQNE